MFQRILGIDLRHSCRKKFSDLNSPLVRKIRNSKEMQRSALPSARPRSSSLSLLCLGFISISATAASIDFAGIETGTPVQNWSNDGVPKTFDLNNDDRFGGAGYYQITPAVIGTGSHTEAVSEGNNLGVTLAAEEIPQGQLNTQCSPPDFLVSNPLGDAGNLYNFESNPEYRAADGVTWLRQGALAVTINNYEFLAPGAVLGNWNNAFTFTLGESSSFRLGVAVDSLTLGNGAYGADYVSIYNIETGEVFSELLTRDGISDMVFFDIEGGTGDEFAVRLWQTTGEPFGPVAFSLITFDQLPGPPAPTLSYVLNGNSFTLSWEPTAIGWTLESSTDLGSIWIPVTDPPVVNNSVTLDITGVPQRFFRLRKDP